jgi:predicted ATPase
VLVVERAPVLGVDFAAGSDDVPTSAGGGGGSRPSRPRGGADASRRFVALVDAAYEAGTLLCLTGVEGKGVATVDGLFDASCDVQVREDEEGDAEVSTSSAGCEGGGVGGVGGGGGRGGGGGVGGGGGGGGGGGASLLPLGEMAGGGSSGDSGEHRAATAGAAVGSVGVVEGGGSSGRLTTFVDVLAPPLPLAPSSPSSSPPPPPGPAVRVEWSATGRVGVSLAALSAVRDVNFAFGRAASRLAEMHRGNDQDRGERDARAPQLGFHARHERRLRAAAVCPSR